MFQYHPDLTAAMADARRAVLLAEADRHRRVTHARRTAAADGDSAADCAADSAAGGARRRPGRWWTWWPGRRRARRHLARVAGTAP